MNLTDYTIIGCATTIAILMSILPFVNAQEYPLCIEFEGEQRCDYTWEVVGSLDKGVGQYHPQDKHITVTPYRMLEILLHEMEHAKCDLKYPDNSRLEISQCNYNLDKEYTVQGTHGTYPTPKPPIISGKMAYTTGQLDRPDLYMYEDLYPGTIDIGMRLQK